MSELKLFDPFGVESLDDDIRRLMRPWRLASTDAAPRIKLDVSETDSAYAVKAEIPGVKKDDIDVRVDGRQVTISAEIRQEKEEKNNGRVLRSEREHGYASRSFALAFPVDEAKVDARYENGVLSLVLPKKAQPSSQRIAVR